MPGVTRRSEKAIPWILGGAIGYATLRYNVFKGTPWSDWPTLVLNKALGFASLALIVLAVFRLRRSTPVPPGQILHAAGLLATLHVLLSLILLNPACYPKFFQQDKLTAAAGWSMLLGSVAALAMAAGAKRHDHPRPGRRNLRLPLLAFGVGLHAMFQASPAWFQPSQWPGIMPPITLLSFLLGLAALALAPRAKHSP